MLERRTAVQSRVIPVLGWKPEPHMGFSVSLNKEMGVVALRQLTKQRKSVQSLWM